MKVDQESGVTSGVAGTEAQSEVMASTAAKFDTVNSSLTAMLKQLMGDLSVLQTAWKGLAAGEFEKVRAQYEKDLTDLNRALSETAVAIKDSGQSYDTTDATNAANVTKSAGSYTLPL